MSSAIKVGGKVACVTMKERGRRTVYETKIVRETATLWISESGKRFRKSDGEQTPQYRPEPRKIEPIAGGKERQCQRCTVVVDDTDRECGMPLPCPDHGEAE